MPRATFRERASHETGFADVFAEEIAPYLPPIETARRQRLKLFSGFVAAAGVIFLLAYTLPAPRGDGGHAVLPVVMMLIAVLPAVGAGVVWLRHKGDLRQVITDPVCRFLGDVHYARNPGPGAPDPRTFRRQGVLPKSDKPETEDHVTGFYRGTEFSLIETKCARRAPNSAGVVKFQGLLMTVEVPQAFAGRVLILPAARTPLGVAWRWLSNRVPDQMARVRFDDAAFARRFDLFADNGATARDLLVPAFRRTLLELERRHRDPLTKRIRPWRQGRLAAAFSNGTFHMALPGCGRNRFEVGSLFRSVWRCERDIRRFMQDVIDARTVIDLLHDGADPQRV